MNESGPINSDEDFLNELMNPTTNSNEQKEDPRSDENKTAEIFGVTNNSASSLSQLPVVGSDQLPADVSEQSGDDKLNILNDKLKIIDGIVPTLMENINKTIKEYELLKLKLNKETTELLDLKSKYQDDIKKISKILDNDNDIKDKYKLNFDDPNTVPDIDKIVDAITEMLTKYVNQNNETIKKSELQGKDFDELKNRLSNFENAKTQLENTRNKTLEEMSSTADNIIKQLKIMEVNINPDASAEQSGGKRQKRNKKVTKKAKVKNNSKKRNKKTRSKKNKRTRKHRN